MRLLEVGSFEFQEFIGNNTPRYAILSHTWEDEEVSFQEMRQLTPHTRNKKGFAKIRETCRLAAAHGVKYAWIDTCCIDKSSSAELTEAINSMYQWYRQSAVCYAFLSDVDDPADETALAASRWFTRGWTLQELIAPEKVIFWSRSWVDIGTKRDLCDSLQSITNIPADLLMDHSILDSYSIARRMSWASKRETTRVEDTAYCLLGLFNINMSLLYGEGSNAFYRLQEELVKSTTDASLFAWTQDDAAQRHDLVSVFADHPRCFANSKDLPPLTDTIHESLTITNRGIALRVCLGMFPSPTSNRAYILCLGTIPPSPESPADAEPKTVCIYLRQTLPATFSRWHYDLLPMVTSKLRLLGRIQPIYLATRDALPLFHRPVHLQVPTEYMTRSCRISTLQMEALPRGTWRIRVSPLSNYDVQDKLFFSTSPHPVGGGWALFRIEGVFSSPTGVKYLLDLMCYVFGWARATGEVQWVLINARAETPETEHTLQTDSSAMKFERDSDRIWRMLAQYGGWTSEVVVWPDTGETDGKTADVMVAKLSVKRLDVQTLSDYDKLQAPCAKNWTKVKVLLVPREQEAKELVST